MLNATGDVTIGPIGGVPSGLVTVYAVAIGFPGPFGTMPMVSTAPKTYTVP